MWIRVSGRENRLDLPVQAPTKYEVVINRNREGALGLEVRIRDRYCRRGLSSDGVKRRELITFIGGRNGSMAARGARR